MDSSRPPADMVIKVIIPAYNEEKSIARVIRDIPAGIAEEVIVVNNGSTDSTASVAASAGATVLDEDSPGYGNACLRGISYISSQELLPDIVVFLDGDYSDYPDDMPDIIKPIIDGSADIVIGARAGNSREAGAMAPHQVFGNWLATRLLKLVHGVSYSDLGPFRAIRYNALMNLGMEDRDFGWTMEMQVKAAKQRLKYTEVPVRYRRRIGTSKVSGTIRGSIMAGYKILWTLVKYR